MTPPRTQSWRQAKPGCEFWSMWLRNAVPPPRPHPTPGPPQAQGTCMLSEPSRLRFLCPYPLRFLPRVLRNHRTPSCLQEATRQGGSSRKKKKKKKKSKERRKTNKRAFPFSWCPAALQVGDQAVPAPPLSAPALRCSRREHRLAESWVWTGQAARAALLLCLPGGEEGGPGRSSLTPLPTHMHPHPHTRAFRFCPGILQRDKGLRW